MIVAVTSADDVRIAAFRDVRERDLVGRGSGFMAEGEVVLRLLARHMARTGAAGAGHRLEALLISQRQADRLAGLLASLPDDLPAYVAPQAVMDDISGFPIHRGVLALGRSHPARDAGALLDALGPRAVVVAALGITNHDNMGGIFRNAAAFGAGAVLIDRASCDPLYRKAIRVSVGASLTVPFARVADAGALLDLLAARGFAALALSPSGAERLADVVPPARVAALFGTEGPGLPADILARTRTVAIPMARDFDSLNVATTCGIVLHHLAQAGRVD
ncbi:TrmH family RNA methyltransferase [Xanthobacter tagetidis]|jgi:tRNA G18 (ribose-2'-O)-methylase SpoU|uniref:RNA methyltransferase n=1 Tax=Xanthobacter tagetidis TaxID=60216 RepID=A0A3L7AFS9_9HYPH|nr:RNA methyltransferase [Xanthobacter tagetidis]MBB6308633.1 tRNA G18 (ribose-2'-O)-methylase SpoU [Xanthobacter tagetidis]RLP78610.1 RNA methyltransferase [Xanthobacter tagetidis]